jgi:hypothetical protein
MNIILKYYYHSTSIAIKKNVGFCIIIKTINTVKLVLERVLLSRCFNSSATAALV